MTNSQLHLNEPPCTYRENPAAWKEYHASKFDLFARIKTEQAAKLQAEIESWKQLLKTAKGKAKKEIEWRIADFVEAEKWARYIAYIMAKNAKYWREEFNHIPVSKIQAMLVATTATNETADEVLPVVKTTKKWFSTAEEIAENFIKEMSNTNKR